MSAQSASATPNVPNFPNGGGAAAVLAAGIGSFLLSVFAILGDQSAFFKKLFVFYNQLARSPASPPAPWLSGF